MYAVISFEVHSLVLGVGIFSVNVFTGVQFYRHYSTVDYSPYEWCSAVFYSSLRVVDTDASVGPMPPSGRRS